MSERTKRAAPAALAALLVAAGSGFALPGDCETADARATVALPARTFLEKSGAFTNSRGLVQPFSAVVEPTFEAWSESDALAQIAAAAGIP